jgi:hypothetical protein
MMSSTDFQVTILWISVSVEKFPDKYLSILMYIFTISSQNLIDIKFKGGVTSKKLNILETF